MFPSLTGRLRRRIALFSLSSLVGASDESSLGISTVDDEDTCAEGTSDTDSESESGGCEDFTD